MLKTILLGILIGVSAYASGSSTPIAVTEFRQEVDHWYESCNRWNGWRRSDQLKTVLEKKLSDLGFKVLERQNIKKMYEDEFKMENLNPATKSAEKKFIAAKYAVTGGVVEMGICEDQNDTGIELGGIVSLLGGPETGASLKLGGATSKVKLAAKLIDVSTGVVLKSFESETESNEKDLGVSASVLGIGAQHRKSKTPPIERAMNESLGNIAKEIAEYIAERK